MKLAAPLANFRQPLLIAIAIAVSCGCGGREYETAEVEGIVTINGRPGDGIRIEYAPDGSQGGKGPSSTAETDDQGRFQLQFYDGNVGSMQRGAAVGWHRIVVTDQRLAGSATGRDLKMRLPAEYMSIGSTSLKREVVSGKQSHEITIP
ncbi:hypothetical protein [Lacipirellula parvula]|uniref:ATPase n=1 Tax=Lacipirellula parvula TaxID=2650471 RepID=A0A5K7XFF9_9BACT|nr:hypothetical protein [Lacipirellula parvula]BBO35604.1 ATPase [Lacipirellula parvula]